MATRKKATVFLLMLLCVPSVRGGSSTDGDWFGSFERPGGHVFVVTHFVSTNNKAIGTIDFTSPIKVTMGKPLTKLELNPSRVHFEVPDNATRFSFEGQITNGVITGMVEERGKKFPMRMDWFAKTDPSRYAGIYRVGPGHFIRIGTNMISLFAFDFQSAQLRLLLPRSDA